MTEYGYARVSAKDQNLARQFSALIEAGLKREFIFSDKATGKNFKRPGYRRMLKIVKPGDTVYIKSIDRLGRNYEEIIAEWRLITKVKGVHIVVLDMPILDTRIDVAGITGVFITDIVLQVLSYVAQIERENIKQRQAEGIALAKKKGVKFGRPKLSRPNNYDAIKQAYNTGKITRKEASEQLNVSVSTFVNWLHTDNKNSSNCFN
jgi:DNA invertase Pin-like site-specific DNA recombinase